VELFGSSVKVLALKERAAPNLLSRINFRSTLPQPIKAKYDTDATANNLLSPRRQPWALTTLFFYYAVASVAISSELLCGAMNRKSQEQLSFGRQSSTFNPL